MYPTVYGGIHLQNRTVYTIVLACAFAISARTPYFELQLNQGLASPGEDLEPACADGDFPPVSWRYINEVIVVPIWDRANTPNGTDLPNTLIAGGSPAAP